MKRLAAALAFALVWSVPAAAQEGGRWQPVDDQTGQIRDLSGLEALAEAFPDSGSVQVRLLQAQLSEGDVSAALETLDWLQERGHVFSPAVQDRIVELVGAEYADQARGLLIGEATPLENSEVVMEVNAKLGLIDNVFSLDGEEVFLAGSLTDNGIYLLSPGNLIRISVEVDGTDTAFSNDVVAVLSDIERDVGWASLSNMDGSEDDQSLFSGLVGMSPRGTSNHYVAAPEGVSVSDITLGTNGEVYASDPLGGGVYRGSFELSALEVIVPPGTLRSPQGMAVSEDGRRLYVSDYRYGIAIVDLETREVSRLESDVPVMLDGVDGLELYEGELIAVQNGLSPIRISGFTLSEDGNRIVGSRLLEQAHSEWTEPVGAHVIGDSLFYIGTGQWDRYQGGELREGAEAIATEIRRIPLNR